MQNKIGGGIKLAFFCCRPGSLPGFLQLKSLPKSLIRTVHQFFHWFQNLFHGFYKVFHGVS